MRIILVLMAILVLAGGAYHFLTQKDAGDLSQQASDMADKAADTIKEGADQVASLTADGVDLGKQISQTFADLKTSLERVTDAPSAEEVKPQLEELKGKIEGWGEDAEKLPAEGKTALAKTVAEALPSLENMAAKTEGIGGGGGPGIEADTGRYPSQPENLERGQRLKLLRAFSAEPLISVFWRRGYEGQVR